MSRISLKKITAALLLACLLFFSVPFCFAQPAQDYNDAKFKSALRAYRKMADQNDVKGYLNLAEIFKNLSHHETGIKVLNCARRKFKDDPRVLGLLGRLYYLNGQVDESIIVFTALNRIKPDDLDALITLGLCYQEKKDDRSAQPFFQKALELNKNNVFARLSLADLYYRQNRLEESAREYRALSFIDSSMGQIYEYWADILYKLGNFKEALRVYEKITFMDPRNKAAAGKLDEIRQKLGKEYFEKEKAQRKESKERKLVFVTPAPAIKNAVNVRIILARTDSSAEFKCSTDFTVKSKSTGLVVGRGAAGESYSVRLGAGNKLLISGEKNDDLSAGEQAVISPAGPEGTITLFDVKNGGNNFWSNIADRSYRGQIELDADQGGVTMINLLSLEEYLYGVIPAEMPTNWPSEALKAQAVAARSESIAKLSRHKAEGADLCAEVHCQAYSGVEKETQLGNMAVDSTRGQILEYNSKAVDAIYSANCGGHTQGNIFGDPGDAPYLTGIADMADDRKMEFPLSPYDLDFWLKDPPPGIYCGNPEYSKGSSFRWVRIYSAAQLRQLMDNYSAVGKIRKIIVLKRNPSGHVSKIKVVGADGSRVIEKELNIRKALGNLRSSMFKVEARYGRDRFPLEFVFYGGGWGHGAGMCQSGASGMAVAGKNYEQILKHYFPGTALKKAY